MNKNKLLKRGNGQPERIGTISEKWTIKGGGIGWIGPSLDNCRMTTVLNHRMISLFDKAECSSEQATRKTMFLFAYPPIFRYLCQNEDSRRFFGYGHLSWHGRFILSLKQAEIDIHIIRSLNVLGIKLTLIKKTRCSKYSYCMFYTKGLLICLLGSTLFRNSVGSCCSLGV